jgi:hypothetical protein
MIDAQLHFRNISTEQRQLPTIFYNQLRKAGVGLHTCCEGAIDLEDFAKQLLLFVNQKANNDFLMELSAKMLRSKITNAKTGGFCGGPAWYGMDRALFDADGRLVRRLQTGERVKIRDHRIKLIPTTDPVKLAAIRYLFERMDTADVGLRELAREMDAKGFPSPRGKGWRNGSLVRILRDPIYIGTAHWGALAKGKYHIARGEDIIPVKRNGKRKTDRKPREEVISVPGAIVGMIAPKQFHRVAAKLKHNTATKPRVTRHEEYLLTGLIFCKHCGRKMIGATGYGHDRKGQSVYRYSRYMCSGYAMFKRGSLANPTCGHQTVPADRVQKWLVYKLQEVFLGPGRDVLVEEIKRQLSVQAKAPSVDTGRLEKRAADLDREVGRLVKAIRTVDAAELVEELAMIRNERDRVKAELAQAGKQAEPIDVAAETEQIADSLMDLGQQLADGDPAVLREVFNRLISRIECRWKHRHSGKRDRWELIEGQVTLRPQTPLSVYGVVEHPTKRMS